MTNAEKLRKARELLEEVVHDLDGIAEKGDKAAEHRKQARVNLEEAHYYMLGVELYLDRDRAGYLNC